MNPIHFDLTILVQVISFLLLVWILGKVAWKPLMKMMEQRRNYIETNLLNAENERKQAEQIRQEYQAEMLKARQDAQEIIAKATKISEERAAEMIIAARSEAEKIKHSTMQDIEREKARAIAEVRAQVADLSVSIAEKIIRQKIDVQIEDQLFKKLIQEVGDLQC